MAERLKLEEQNLIAAAKTWYQIRSTIAKGVVYRDACRLLSTAVEELIAEEEQ